jgi:hypothetical protein
MNLYGGFESYKAETFGAVLSLSSTLQTLLQGARRRLKLTMTRNCKLMTFLHLILTLIVFAHVLSIREKLQPGGRGYIT